MITTKISSVLIGTVLTASGSTALAAPNIATYIIAAASVVTGTIIVVSYIKKEVSSSQEIKDKLKQLHESVQELTTTCKSRGKTSVALGNRVSKLEGAK